MLLLTPQGWCPVETLQEGDWLLGADGEAHPILWVWRGTQALDGTGNPVLISRGALGPNRPFADLIVSPQHRIALDGSTFAPAKALTALKGIREMRGKREITWHHFACAAHIVVLASGVESESLLLGPQVLKFLRKADLLHRLYSLFKNTEKGGILTVLPALPCFTVAAARRRLAAFEKPAQDTASDAAPCGPFELTNNLIGERFAKTVAF
nr:Hint domain-containing protein [Lentibacter algarum]